MLICAYIVIMYYFLPQLVAYANALTHPLLAILIGASGFTMLFASVGLKISNNLGSTVVNGIFRGIGYIVRTLFQAIGWVFRSTFDLIPRVFRESRRVFIDNMGLSPLVGNALATATSVVVLVIII